MPAVPQDIQAVILKCWQRYGLKAEDGWKLRRKAQTDGYWFAKELLGYKEFSECHKEVFDFFVQKDPDAEDFKSFAEQYSGSHDDLLMLCRGGFKSTADIVDAIQWIITFPDIRINIMTGTGPLAEEFVGLLKGHFRTNKDGSPQVGVDGKPRLFQILFPEHCEPKMGESPEWTTPARRKQVAGPTIRATSLESNTTGTHCDVLKCDDCTTQENSKTPGRIKSVNQDITQARRLVEPYGFKLRIGTPYDLSDNLAATVADEEKRAAQGRPSLVRVLLRPALTRKPGFEDVPIDQLTDEMVTLWFGERITLKFLQNEYADALKSDPKTFYSQYLLDLKQGNFTKFSRDRLVAATMPFIQIPDLRDGHIFQAWDLAYGISDSVDFSVGMTGFFFGGRVYLLDMVRGHYDEDLLPRVIAEFAFKWKPERIAVEDSVGTRWLKKEIQREMRRLRYQGPNVEFVSLGMGSKITNKISRAKPVVRLLGDGRLAISNELPQLDTFYDELEIFPPPRGKKDDIVDALSLLVNHFYQEDSFDDAVRAGQANLTEEDEGWYRRIHGLDRPQETDEGPQIFVDPDIQELFQ